MTRSLQGKLGVGLLLSLIITFVALWVFASISIRYLTEDYIYSRLTHDTETLLAVINNDAPSLEVETSRLGAVYQQPFSGHYFKITRGEQVIRSRSLWDQTLDDPADSDRQEVRYYHVGPQQQPLLMLFSRFIRKDQQITIIVAEDLSPVEEAIHRFQVSFTMSMVGILCLLVLLQACVMRRGLKPLTQLQGDLKDLENGSIRYLETKVPSELVPLVDEINHLHSELESKLKRHRNALSDLAHALKKPLTVIQQLSKDPELEMLPHIKQALLRQAETTQQLTQRILNRARLAGDVQTGKPFDFEGDLAGLLDTLKMMYRDKHITFVTDISVANPCRYDREDMLELLGNLLDNACKWAKETVSITISQSSVLVFIIEDDGPGAPEEFLNRLNQRGVRLDESVEGHGLGLAIVSDIVSHFDGKMNSGMSKNLGGLRIDITLP